MLKSTNVYVLYTGGTIGMFPEDPSNPASPLLPGGRDDLIRYIPNLEAEGISFDMAPLADMDGSPIDPVDSAEVMSDHWRFMARQIRDVYDDYDGFVILHGTDTMAYTASALSFMLENLSKPVVVTGSQLPIAHPRTDAVTNFVNSMYVAGHKATGLPLVPEVSICFADELLRGNRVTKMSTTKWAGFQSPNADALGTIGEHIEIDTRMVRKPSSAPFSVITEIDNRVLDLTLFPGISPATISSMLRSTDLKGVVLRTFGSGNAPADPEFLDAIGREIADQGVVFVNITQCPEGMVEAGRYAASNGLLERGVISGLDLTAEAALTKLMVLLATESRSSVGQQMQVDQAGEQSQNLFDLRYPSFDGAEVSESVVAASMPTATYDHSRFVRAVARLSGLRIEGLANGDQYEVKLFLNRPQATADTPDDDPGFAARFSGEYNAVAGLNLLADVSPAVLAAYRAGRDISLTLVTRGGNRVSGYQSLNLALFTDAISN